MKLTIVEGSTGLQRDFSGGNENMSVSFFMQKISDMYSYDKKRMKVLFQTKILNKLPDKR
jgi:hypothetical protein